MLNFSLKQIGVAVGTGILLLILIVALVGDRKSEIQTSQPESGVRSETVLKDQIPDDTAMSLSESDNRFLVVRVIDGDTIEIEGGQRVRYVGIDTPETVDPRKPVQCFGVEASNKNKEFVGGKRVRLEKDISETDKYGRLLRYVYVDDIFVNLKLVQDGFAYSSTYPPDIKYQDQFVEAQRVAREQNKGLWNTCPAEPSSPVIAPTTTQESAPAQSSQPTSACVIKGNISSGGKIYHLPGCASYNQTEIKEVQGEMWFCSEEEAVAAGWRKAKNCP